jgi:hypothetical protein
MLLFTLAATYCFRTKHESPVTQGRFPHNLFKALSATLPSDRRSNAVCLIRERYMCKEVNAFMVAHEMSTYPGASNSEREDLMNWILQRGEARGPYVEDAI